MKSSKLKSLIVLLLVLLEPTSQIQAQEAKRNYSASRIQPNQSVEIDGRINEALWLDGSANWDTNFIQRLPNEGLSPTSQTKFNIKYDARYLYVAFQCSEKDVRNINQRMSRRDGYNGDWVEIILDSYNDQRTAFSFSLSAAGVKSDKYITLNGAEEDLAWNPIWYAKSAMTSEGWTAEMKIPLSQLRFSSIQNQVWGFQVQRRILRNEELSVWQRIPQDAPGWVSEFGKLTGISELKPQRQLEIQPFIVSSVNSFEKDQQNPFRDSDIFEANIGIDGKLGITNDITLDFTINPDFGQVEADPAAIALDGFQLFFQEQRPFFIENKNIFDYRFSSPIIGSPFSTDNLFYSRRIGRKPQRNVSVSSGEYVETPNQTTILGAMKLSGKTKRGLSFGVLESMTKEEHAEISNGQDSYYELLEPRTNYFMARVLQDLNQRNTFIGGAFTSVIRSNDSETNFLHRKARSGGLDFLHQWGDRTWYIGANLVFSYVNGSKESILRTQLSVPHSFQRNASHLNVDSTRTSLSGSGGDIKFGKAGNGNIQMETGLTWRSPQLELNDIGFMREADVIQHYGGLTYRSTNSFGIFRSARAGYRHWFNWDFAGKLNYIDWDVSLDATLQNNWSGTLGFFSQPHVYSKSLLQGGPRMFLADQFGFWWAANSDSRKKFFFNYSGWAKTGGTGSYYLMENGITLTYQPANRFKFSVRPRYTIIRHRLQYNETIILGSQVRHIVSLLDQNTLSLVLRGDMVITPNMVIQYYAEPFISTGRYSDFGYVVNPSEALDQNQLQLLSISNNEQARSERLAVDENSDQVTDFEIANPNFSFVQFRSNLVFRWEYRPGSELYLVWAQNMADTQLPRGGLIHSIRDQVFSRTLNSTFLIKMTYRFHR